MRHCLKWNDMVLLVHLELPCKDRRTGGRYFVDMFNRFDTLLDRDRRAYRQADTFR